MTRTRPTTAERIDAHQPGSAGCAWPGCTHEGVHRAPKDRSLKSYDLYCLEHVRAYNAKWDFHIHMTPKDIELEIRRMATWDRPTWPLGSNGGASRKSGSTRIDDPFDLARETPLDRKRKKDGKKESWIEAMGFRPDERRALRVLNIDQPVTSVELKRLYKEMVKRHHPDKNGGSKEAETRMKAINAAYQAVSAALRRSESS